MNRTEKSDKKSLILQAAKDCLGRYGFEKTTLDDIGKLVGLNKASLYYYYKNKESIFTEVIFNETKEFIEVLQTKVGKVENSEKKIRTYLVERLRYYQHVANLHNLSLEVMHSVRALFHELYQTVLQKEIDFMDVLLQEGIANSEFVVCDTKRVAWSILTISDAIKHSAHESPDVNMLLKIDYSEIEEDILFTVSLLLRGIKKPKPLEC